jgi:enediyne biosynthesis protein E5
MSNSVPVAALRTKRDPRVGLRTAATLATVLTVLGHTVLGFEQPWSMVFVALVTGYATALGLEWIDARANGRPPGFAGGGIRKCADFLVSAHMTAITTSFLLYTNSRVGAMAFAVAAAIASKYVFRVSVDGRPQHFMNPSNFGIVLTLLLFPWVSTMPYIFTARVTGAWDVIIPIVMAALGFRLNLLFAERLPLIAAWVAAFVLQAVVRWSFFDDISLLAALAPMTGATFVLFTFYMITDPRTTPSSVRGQIAFGLSIGAAYGLVVSLRIVFTFFFAVTIAALLRGAVLYAARWRRTLAEQPLEPQARRAEHPWMTP